MRTMRGLLVCAMLAITARGVWGTMPGAGPGSHYSGLRWGYSVEVPPGWEQVPDDVVQSAAAQMQKPGGKVVFDAAFQAAGSGRWLSYPYAIVQVIPYANLGLEGELPESQFAAVVKSLTGSDAIKRIDDAMPTTLRGKVSATGVHDAVLEPEQRRFHYALAMNVAGVGPVEGASTAYFGRNALVQVSYYALAPGGPDAPAQEAAGRGLRNSLVFDPGHSYNPALAVALPTTGGTTLFQGVGPAMARGAILGVVVTVVGLVFRKRRTK